MAGLTQHTDDPLTALADYLDSQREAVLETWRRAVDSDPALTTGHSLPRAQLRDHIPNLLDSFARVLRSSSGLSPIGPSSPKQAEGAEHGLQRWQQGYRLCELTRELGLLHQCVADELERYTQDHPKLGLAQAACARRTWSELCWQGVVDSTTEYHRLQRAEAAGQARDLGQALAELQETDRRRVAALREAAHDLRGNVGVVHNATAILGQPGMPEAMRADVVRLLQNNVAALLDMLNDLMSLARLEAGHESRDVKSFDAASLLTELCAGAQAVARERGLYLKAEGPASLPVQGDAAKVRRIAQNLLLNALKYTEQGGVTVAWSTGGGKDKERWVLSMRDTGPGFHAGPGAPMAGALEEATASAQEVEKAGQRGTSVAPTPIPSPDPRPTHQQSGEGIGLSIVKRLCELLDASMELESKPGEGSIFRIKLPIQYDGMS